MNRILLIGASILVAALTAGAALAFDAKSLDVPDDQQSAAMAVQTWLDSRGIDAELKGKAIILSKENMKVAILPLVFTKQLDRLLFETEFIAKEGFQGSKELAEAVAKANVSQNFVKVALDKDGDLLIQSNMTFYDNFTAHEFDAFLQLFSDVTRRNVLTPDMLKYLK